MKSCKSLKAQVHKSYIKNMKNHAIKSAAQISPTLNKFCNLSTFKMGKTWHFIFYTIDTIKKLSCYIKDTKIRLK
jgi:hypothetical protein